MESINLVRKGEGGWVKTIRKRGPQKDQKGFGSGWQNRGRKKKRG